MSRLKALLAGLALVQLAAPVPAAASTVVMVPGCGSGGQAIPLDIPMRDKQNSQCCGKLCHVNDRKRSSGQCCGPEDDRDEP
jgi:hypothetical protein